MTIFSSVVKENCKNEKLFEIEMNNTAKHNMHSTTMDIRIRG